MDTESNSLDEIYETLVQLMAIAILRDANAPLRIHMAMKVASEIQGETSEYQLH